MYMSKKTITKIMNYIKTQNVATDRWRDWIIQYQSFCHIYKNKFHASGNSDDDSDVKNFHGDALRLHDVDDDYYDHDDGDYKDDEFDTKFLCFLFLV